MSMEMNRNGLVYSPEVVAKIEQELKELYDEYSKYFYQGQFLKMDVDKFFPTFSLEPTHPEDLSLEKFLEDYPKNRLHYQLLAKQMEVS